MVAVTALSHLSGGHNMLVCMHVCETAVGNKSDREDRCVAAEEAKQLANELKVSFVETSAKDNSNVEEVIAFCGRFGFPQVAGTGPRKAGAERADLVKVGSHAGCMVTMRPDFFVVSGAI